MREKLIILFILFGIFGCINKENPNNSIPEIFKPSLIGINEKEFPVKIGNILEFNIDNSKIIAIVLDFKIEQNQKYIGLCFLNENKLFGRQIPSGMINTTCIDLLDFLYLNIKSDSEYKIIEELIIDNEKVGIGSFGFADNLTELKNSYLLGVNQRKKEQTPCENSITNINAINECYFGVEKYKK